MTNNNTTTESKTMTFSSTAQKVIDWAYLTVGTDCNVVGRLRSAIESVEASVAVELESVITGINEIEARKEAKAHEIANQNMGV